MGEDDDVHFSSAGYKGDRAWHPQGAMRTPQAKRSSDWIEQAEGMRIHRRHVPTMRAAAAPAAGRRSLLARGIWLALLALTLAIFFASLPAYLAQLQTPCGGAACEFQQLTPGQVGALAELGLSIEGYAALTLALLLAGMAVCWGVSALIVWRRPDERMALLVALLLLALGPLSVAVSLPTGPTPWQQPYTYLVLLVNALLVLVFLLFPSGGFSPRWTRWAMVVLLAAQVPATFLPVVWLLPDSSAGQLGWLVSLAELALVAGVQLYRYHWVSTPLERQQTKWVVVGLAIPIAVSLGMTALGLGIPALAASSAAFGLAYNEGVFLFSFCLPLAFGFAVLRYRLWDIDSLINRALVYGSLTATLTAVFVGLVIGLQALLGSLLGGIDQDSGQDSGVAIVVSTLAIVILIGPLRRRLQAVIDRRFYRRKYDAAKIVEAFSAKLRQEVSLTELHERLIGVVNETMRPAHLSLWLASPVNERDAERPDATAPEAPQARARP